MRVHHASPHPRDLEVEVLDPDATVADLAEALEPGRPAGPLVVDGRTVPAATPLDRAGIGDGAVVSRAEGAPTHEPAAPVAELVVTAGLDAGRRLPLRPGRWVLGRAPGPDAPPEPGHLGVLDPTVSARHARVDVGARGSVTVVDAGSTNGTTLDARPVLAPTPLTADGSLRCGAATLVARPPQAAEHPEPSPPRGSSTRPWHRGPRAAPPAPPPPIDVPPAPEPPPASTPVGVVAVVASVAVAGVTVVLFGSWNYAAFALLGPVLALAGAADARARRRRHARRARRQRAAALDRLATQLAGARAAAGRAAESLTPGVLAALERIERHDPRLWERRSTDPDAHVVRLGTGRVPWAPPVAGERHDHDVAAVVASSGELEAAPVPLPLDPERPVAVVGDRPAALAVVRALVVQAVALHGPADLRVAVLAAPGRAGDWDWCAWLPHARDADGTGLLAGGPQAAAAVVTALTTPASGGEEGPRCVVVVDDPDGLAARRGPVRTLLRAAGASPVVPVVVAGSLDDVPARCAVTLAVAADGTVEVPPDLARGPVTATGIARDTAAHAARRLARLDDPEVDDAGRGLPHRVPLAALVGRDRLTSAALAARWRAAGPDPRPLAVLGVGPEGPLEVDLATDGPHALVAGTTGAGKSELLRTLVASLALRSSPDHLTFVLVDFKGGSAFDACADLPHTTGVVTDLDQHLGARALRCLEAELRHREERLRAAGVEDLAGLRRAAPAGDPLPRLVVVVDEFATLAAELPDFVDALVGIAQRGRSLGVHLVLATQRPAGAVSDHIRANIALRVALRVQDATDSTDVIDVPDAAALPRRVPGRALVRLGPGELLPLQTALATARTLPHAADGIGIGGGSPVPGGALRVAPLGVTRDEPAGHAPGSAGGGEPRVRAAAGPSRTDLDALVDAAAAAWRSLDGRPPRRPWPEPLPGEVAWPIHGEHAGPHELVLGLADDPERQRHRPFTWRLGDGPLLVAGIPGSGTTTAAATAVLAACARWDAATCHVHVLDLGAGGLVPLAGLPQVGAVVGASETERQRRLVEELAADVDRRRARRAGTEPGHAPPGEGGAPRRLVVVDGVGAFRAQWDEAEPGGAWDRLLDVAARGAEVGVHVLLCAEGTAAVPHRLATTCRQRLVLRLADRVDHAALGVPPGAVPDLPPGRGLAAEDGALVQVARPPDGLAAAVARLAGASTDARHGGPAPVGTLPLEVDLAGLHRRSPGVRRDDGGLELVVGVADRGLVPAAVVLPPGGHALVAGPPRSGRSTALAALAAAAHEIGVDVVEVAGGPSLDDGRLDAALARGGPQLVLVDDADLVAADHPLLGALVRDRRPGRHVVAACRADRARTLFAHWVGEVRVDGCGLLLRPDPDLDGELLGARLPRRGPVPPAPGRGWCVGGTPEGVVQIGRLRAVARSGLFM